MIVAGCDLRYVAMFPIGAFILMIALIAYFTARAAAWKWKCPYCGHAEGMCPINPDGGPPKEIRCVACDKYSPYGNG
jgi:hypothetical protein